MTTFALNDDHDIYIAGGAIALVTEADAVVQKIRTLLRVYLGEWWLDLGVGVPWFQELLANPADLENVERVLKELIIGVEGVEVITEFSAVFDPSDRAFRVTFRVQTIYGPSGPEELVVA